jgi:hypothetical protein
MNITQRRYGAKNGGETYKVFQEAFCTKLKLKTL